MDNIPGKVKLHIMAVNFPNYRHNEIRTIMEKSGHDIFFCNLENSQKELISIFPDYIIFSLNSDSENNDPALIKLKGVADDLRIPLTMIETYEDDNKLVFQINRIIAELITSPFGKNFFFKYIDGVIKAFSTKDRVKISGDSSMIINSLLTALISQKRLDIPVISEEVQIESINPQSLGEGKRKLEEKLWAAFENRKFRLYYQPVFSLSSNRIAGFEALIRLVDENGHIVTPEKFISVAEESALISPLGLWIVDEACRQITLWKEQFHLDCPLRINVNISPRQFIFPDLTKNIFQIVEKYSIQPEDIGFEITESAFMADMESANIALLELRSRKFSLYMDDFGTGYSSLSYLMHFPMDIIKIDQSFIKWMHIDEQSEILVKSIITLAHNLGLKVVAEGTDDESHIDLLKGYGCDYAQGYYFAKPLTPEDAEAFLDKYFQRK